MYDFVTYIIFVDIVFQKEVQTAKWSDDGTRNGEDDDHGKDEHHPGVMFPEPELQPDRSSDGGNVSFTLGQTNLDKIPDHLRKPAVKK